MAFRVDGGGFIAFVRRLESLQLRIIADARSPSIQLLTTTRHIQSTFPIRMATAWRSPHDHDALRKALTELREQAASRQLAGKVKVLARGIVADGEAG